MMGMGGGTIESLMEGSDGSGFEWFDNVVKDGGGGIK